jgi:hypothetical protein
MLLYPINVPGLLRSALTGANGSDPTIPYSPSWARRLGSALSSIVRRNRRQAPQTPCGADERERPGCTALDLLEQVGEPLRGRTEPSPDSHWLVTG